MIKLIRDSKDFIFAKRYGQTVIFPIELNVDTATPDTIQPAGNVMCTAITTCDIGSDQTGVEYDYEYLFSQVDTTAQGAEPRKVLGEAVKNGLKRKDGVIEKKWKSYFRADTGSLDYFDNIRSAIYLAQSPVGLAIPWYWEWVNETVMSEGKSLANYHMCSVEGWKIINGEPMLIIEAWNGRKMYMSRAVCNKVMSALGSQAWVLATDEITERRDVSILQKIVDLLTNFIISFKKPTPMPEEQEAPIVSEPTKREELYNLAKSLLGKHLTLNANVSKNYGCAQALSYVLLKFSCPIPKGGISGTATMYEWLLDNFDEVAVGEPGDVIINVTGSGISTRRGHTGILGKYQIMSNNSITGKWDSAWELPNWIRFYEEQGKMKTHYFRVRE